MTVFRERRIDVVLPDNNLQPAPVGLSVQQHVVHIFPTFGIGGVPLRICTVVDKLGGAFRHTIISLDSCYDSRERLGEASQVDYADFLVPTVGTMQSVWNAVGHLRTLKPDVLATYNWGSIEWALANTLVTRRHHVHFESGFGPEEADRQIPRRVNMRRLALVGASYLVVPSYTLERIATEIWRIRRDKVRRVENGVDVEKYQSSAGLSSALGVTRAPDELIVGTVAPLRREKNVGRLIEAFAALPDIGRPVRLVIAGDGSERTALEQLARDLGVAEHTVFLGHIDAVEQALGLIDVFVMSSDTEQMPNALLQAMAASCAVASVDVGDVGIIVAPENYPFIVPRDEPGALTDAMTRLLCDDALRMLTARANLAHVRKSYSMDRMVGAYRSLYEGRVPNALVWQPEPDGVQS